MTDLAHNAVEVVPEPRRRTGRAADNALVRAVGRVPLPLGAKLIAGFAVVAALLAVVAILGLVALNKSNSRGLELPRLKEEASYEHVLQTDADNLYAPIHFRLIARETGSSRSYDKKLAATLKQLCADAGHGSCGMPPDNRFPDTLNGVSESRYLQLENAVAQIFYPGRPTNWFLGAAPRMRTTHSSVREEDQFAASFAHGIRKLASTTDGRVVALNAANRRSYIHSRNLLIGVGAGSFALAVALGLLLAASVVKPLRRIRGQLAAIAGGDFARHAEVANRDEIGDLAADVNRMSDELQRAYQELELASEHKSEFLATMSHELRTPLNAIIGFSEVLQEQMFGELNERQIAYVNDVLEAGKHLLSLINDVLDLAKIEAGKMELELSEVAVPDVLRAAVSIHSERASRSGVALALHTEPDEITIIADERRVRQVVFNLLSNAIKFTPAGGRIDITALANNGQVEIAVADTGTGIAAQDLETIFEEFEQTSEGKQAEGTGLGLPLSRKLAELHGGRLWAESTPGKGSIFHFTLPARQETTP